MFGFGFSALSVGGSTFSCSAMTVLSRPAAPAPALRWPILLLAEPSAIRLRSAPPKTLVRLSTSTTSPTLVLVPWASTSVAVAGALGVRQALEQKQPSALAHHEAVGAVAERPRAGGAQSTDLAELDEGGRAHVAIDATGQHGIALALDQQLDRRVHSREGRGAGCVADEAWAAQVEHVCDTSGDDVGQLAWHRVLGDRRQPTADLGLPALQDGVAHAGGELL